MLHGGVELLDHKLLVLVAHVPAQVVLAVEGADAAVDGAEVGAWRLDDAADGHVQLVRLVERAQRDDLKGARVGANYAVLVCFARSEPHRDGCR